MTTQAAGYVRVSTAEQADSGLGLDAQRDALTAEAQRRGWALTLYEDAGASGKSLNGRPGLAEALQAVRTGSAGVLVVAKLDRLSRSLLDFAALMDEARSGGWNVVALDLGVDLSTPAGEMLAGVLASFAQYERRLIGQRTRDAMQVARARGVHLGRPRQVESPLVARMLALRGAGRSFASIAAELNADGVPTVRGGRWHASTVQKVIRYSAGAAGRSAALERCSGVI